MNKLLVITFDRRAAALAGPQALRRLHADGDITLHATGVVARDADGAARLKQAGITVLDTEAARAGSLAQGQLQTQLAPARLRLDAAVQCGHQRMAALRHEADDKVAALERQLGRADGAVKDRPQARVQRLRAASQTRGARLAPARGLLTRETLTP